MTLWRSFGHAWDGLVTAAAQRNMRIHLVAGVLAGSFAATAPLLFVERALIVLCVALVVGAEGCNTAIEALVDLHGERRTEAGRIAKDAAAGAVLALAAGSVVAFGAILFGRWRALIEGARAAAVPLAAAAGLAIVCGLLVLDAPLRRRFTHTLGGAGVILVASLALSSACPPCVLAPAACFGLAWAASARRADLR